MESRTECVVGRLELHGPELTSPDLRRWLADRLEALRGIPGRHETTGCVRFSADVAIDHGAPALARLRFGPHPAPDDWPRLPLDELLDAAAADLRRG